LAKKHPSIKQERPLPKVKIQAEIPWVYAVWTVPMVDTPPTSVPIIIQDTLVNGRERSATENPEAVVTLTDRLTVNSAIRAKVIENTTLYSMLSTQIHMIIGHRKPKIDFLEREITLFPPGNH
jgi:hypothetical protein